MAIKSVQAIVNGVTTTLTYDSASKTYKATFNFGIRREAF